MAIIEPEIPQSERAMFARLCDGSILALSKGKRRISDLFNNKSIYDFPESLRSGGHVIDTLEASLWCCAKSNSFDEAVLLAVNLGGDSDTTGAVTGGLTGIIYGIESINNSWRSMLASSKEISKLCEELVSKILNSNNLGMK